MHQPTTTPHHPFPFQVLFFSLPSHPTHFLPLPFPLLVLKGCLGGRKGEGREKRRRRRRGKLFFLYGGVQFYVLLFFSLLSPLCLLRRRQLSISQFPFVDDGRGPRREKGKKAVLGKVLSGDSPSLSVHTLLLLPRPPPRRGSRSKCITRSPSFPLIRSLPQTKAFFPSIRPRRGRCLKPDPPSSFLPPQDRDWDRGAILPLTEGMMDFAWF